jgi:hypothetical protein
MNKTLLLIICDFLLLNLLALTRWEKAEPPRENATSAAAARAAANPAVNADMVELMRISLEDERATREQVASQLSTTQTVLSEREKSLAALTQQKGQLENALTATQTNVKNLERKYSDAANEALLTKEQLAQMQRELEERRQEAERQKAELARLERQNAEARQRIENLNVAVKVAEQEKQLIVQNLTEAKQQIELERTERQKVQEQTIQLAQGVGQLAEKSGELSREIRDNRPINSNLIFNDFLANRVQTRLTARKPGLFSPTVREKDTQTVLVSDGQRTYALMHVSDTPFSLTPEASQDWEMIAGSLTRGGVNAPVKELHFLALDPRVLVVPLDDDTAAAMAAKVYRLAAEPFKFPEAVVVRADDGRYGDTPFRIDAANPSYVKLDNRIVTRLFGEFAPKRGDLVFSKTGDLIGLMVNNDYCAVLGSFTPVHKLAAGPDVAQPTARGVFADLAARWTRLPLKLQ